MLKRTASLLLLLGFILVAWKWTLPGPVQPPLSFTKAEEILASQWSPSETHLFLLHRKGILTIYDVERNTYRQIQTAANPQYNEDHSLFRSPNGKQVGVAYFKNSHLVFEIYEVASGLQTQQINLPVAVRGIKSIQADWHPSRQMLVVGYADQDYNSGPLQAVDLKSRQTHLILEKANRFAFSGSKLVILTGELLHRDNTFQLHATTDDSFETTPLKIDGTKGKIITFATSSHGLYFTQRSVHNKTERITTNFWRNEEGRFKPTWSNAFEFTARYDAMQDEILPSEESEWAAVSIFFGTDGISGGRIWCVNQNSVISLDNQDSEYYELTAYGWCGSSLAHSSYILNPLAYSYEEAGEIKAHGGKITDEMYFHIDTMTRQRHSLSYDPLAMGTWSWNIISPRLKHMAIFRKEKEVAPWQLFIRPLDWCDKH